MASFRGVLVGTIALAASTIGVSAFAPAAHAAMKGGQPGPVVTPGPIKQPPPPVTPPAPGYKIEAVKFTIVNSNHDFVGSDDPYFVISYDGNQFAGTRNTHTFSGIGSGKSRNFGSTDRCIFPAKCSAGGAVAPSGIGISIEAWDSDEPADAATILENNAFWWHTFAMQNAVPSLVWIDHATHDALSEFGELDDDFIGLYNFVFSPAYLAGLTPKVGASGTLKLPLGDDLYTIDVKITRTA